MSPRNIVEYTPPIDEKRWRINTKTGACASAKSCVDELLKLGVVAPSASDVKKLGKALKAPKSKKTANKSRKKGKSKNAAKLKPACAPEVAARVVASFADDLKRYNPADYSDVPLKVLRNRMHCKVWKTTRAQHPETKELASIVALQVMEQWDRFYKFC